jgi:hypothetical protein
MAEEKQTLPILSSVADHKTELLKKYSALREKTDASLRRAEESNNEHAVSRIKERQDRHQKYHDIRISNLDRIQELENKIADEKDEHEKNLLKSKLEGFKKELAHGERQTAAAEEYDQIQSKIKNTFNDITDPVKFLKRKAKEFAINRIANLMQLKAQKDITQEQDERIESSKEAGEVGGNELMSTEDVSGLGVDHSVDSEETKSYYASMLGFMGRLTTSTEESTEEQIDQNKRDSRTSAGEESAMESGKKDGTNLFSTDKDGGEGEEKEEKKGIFESVSGMFGKDGTLSNMFGKKGSLSKMFSGGKGMLGKGAGMIGNIGSKLPMMGGLMGTAGSAVASAGTAAAGMAGSAMSGIGALAAANPIGAAVLGTLAVGAGAYKLWDTMRGSEESKEAMDAADEAGVVDHNIFGDSTVLNWDAVKKMSPETIQALIDYDDWDSESLKGLETIKAGGDTSAKAEEAVDESVHADKMTDAAIDATAIGMDESGNIRYIKSFTNGMPDVADAEKTLTEDGFRILSESERGDLVAKKESIAQEKQLEAEKALGVETSVQKDIEALPGGVQDPSTLMEKAFDVTPFGFLSNQLGFTTSESDKETGEKSDIFSRITGTTKEGEDESTLMEKVLTGDVTPFGAISNALGFTTSEADKKNQQMEGYALGSVPPQGKGAQPQGTNNVVNAPVTNISNNTIEDKSFNNDPTVQRSNPWGFSNEF